MENNNTSEEVERLNANLEKAKHQLTIAKEQDEKDFVQKKIDKIEAAIIEAELSPEYKAERAAKEEAEKKRIEEEERARIEAEEEDRLRIEEERLRVENEEKLKAQIESQKKTERESVVNAKKDEIDFLEKKIKTFELSLKYIKNKSDKAFAEKKINVFKTVLKINKTQYDKLIEENKKMFCDGGEIENKTSWDRSEIIELLDSFGQDDYEISISNSGHSKGDWGSVDFNVSESDNGILYLNFESEELAKKAFNSLSEELTNPYEFSMRSDVMPNTIKVTFTDNEGKFEDGGEIMSELKCKYGDEIDSVKFDVPLMIRLLEYAREDSKTDMNLHVVTENAIELSKGKDVLTMEDYDKIVNVDEFAKGGRLLSTYTDPKEYLKALGARMDTDLNYSTEKNGIDYYIGYRDSHGTAHAYVVAFIEDESKYMIEKEDAKEMSETARVAGTESVELFTNYGIELRHDEKPQTIGFDKIHKVNVDEFAKGGELGENMEFSIRYLNKKKNYQADTKIFKTYKEALNWGRENIDNFNADMIKVKFAKGGNVPSLCPVGMKVQTIIFDKTSFTKGKAKKWAKQHEYKDRVDETDNFYRMRQINPERFKKDSFKTIEFTEGIKAVVGCPKTK
jgi:hypothetical protein